MESVNLSEDIRPILPMLEGQGIEVICVENGFVRCPGEDCHTTPTADNHCRVYNNSGVPRLHCFHQSCTDLVETANAVFQKRYGGSVTAIAQETIATAVSQSSDEPERRLLEAMAWPYDAICTDLRGLVTDPPEMHHKLLLTLFASDDIVWIGRDLYDTGSERHAFRFKSSDHWLVQQECPGTFICPSTFKAGCHSRSDANVFQRKYLVVESDFLDQNQIGAVFRWLEGLGLTLRAVVDTAGKSLHGWFDMPDLGGLPTLKKELTLLKCDPSMFKPSQPCRLPGARRNGAYQKLIYFNQSSPIVQNKLQDSILAGEFRVALRAREARNVPVPPYVVAPAEGRIADSAASTPGNPSAPSWQPPTGHAEQVVAEPAQNSSIGSPANQEMSGETIVYDNSTMLFHRKMLGGHWITLKRTDLEAHMYVDGWDDTTSKGNRVSLLGLEIVRIQRFAYVHFSGNLAGYKKGILCQGDTRILVTSEPKFIQPQEGDWEMLRIVLYKLFGEEQLPYIFGWLKVSLDMFYSQTWMAGQVIALCGEKGSGKNLFASLVQRVFGGRMPGKPYSYMTGGTDFNSDFMGAELLTIEDEVSQTTIAKRRAFGGRIKALAVNDNHRYHKKGQEAFTVVPLQRLIISLNDEPERLLVLPPLDNDIEDKLSLFKVYKHSMPMPTKTPKERKAFEDALVAQLPAFVHFLNTWQIPEELVVDRFGVLHYHHPDLKAAIQEVSPEVKLLRLICEHYFDPNRASTRFWRGKAHVIERELKSSSVSTVAREAESLLVSTASCGYYLGRLANSHPHRVRRSSVTGGSQVWEIQRPDKDDDDSPVPLTDAQSHLLDRLRAHTAKQNEQKAMAAVGAGTPAAPEPELALEASTAVEGVPESQVVGSKDDAENPAQVESVKEETSPAGTDAKEERGEQSSPQALAAPSE